MKKKKALNAEMARLNQLVEAFDALGLDVRFASRTKTSAPYLVLPLDVAERVLELLRGGSR